MLERDFGKSLTKDAKIL